MRITLSEEDAQRIGCPRELEFRDDRIMGSDLIALEEELGWQVERLDEELLGAPVTNAAGGPVWELDDAGKPVLDNGKPRQARTLKIRTLMVIAWLAARRAVPDLPWKGFDLAITSTEFTPEEPPGKAPSPSSTTTGKRRSPRSSASGRGSSAKS